MVASPFGGVNIEEVAKESPSQIFKDPVDITSGTIPHQTRSVILLSQFTASRVQCVHSLFRDAEGASCQHGQKARILWRVHWWGIQVHIHCTLNKVYCRCYMYLSPRQQTRWWACTDWLLRRMPPQLRSTLLWKWWTMGREKVRMYPHVLWWQYLRCILVSH